MFSRRFSLFLGATDAFLSGTIEAGLTVSGDCELELGTDSTGRATRVMCRRALTNGDMEPEVDEAGDEGEETDDDGTMEE